MNLAVADSPAGLVLRITGSRDFFAGLEFGVLPGVDDGVEVVVVAVGSGLATLTFDLRAVSPSTKATFGSAEVLEIACGSLWATGLGELVSAPKSEKDLLMNALRCSQEPELKSELSGR